MHTPFTIRYAWMLNLILHAGILEDPHAQPSEAGARQWRCYFLVGYGEAVTSETTIVAYIRCR